MPIAILISEDIIIFLFKLFLKLLSIILNYTKKIILKKNYFINILFYLLPILKLIISPLLELKTSP